MPLHSIAAESYTDARELSNIKIDDHLVEFEDPVYLENGRIFAPVRHFVEYFEGEIDWNIELQQATVTTFLGDILIFTVNEYKMQFNGQSYVMDVVPFITEGRTYIPIRHLAEFLHADVSWDETTNTAIITSVPLYTVVEGDEVTRINEQFEITTEWIEERNNKNINEMYWGDQIKVVIPAIMKDKLSLSDVKPESEPAIELHPDFELMARIIMAEAGYESYAGQVAVGSVIMNRVNSTRFPNSVYDVVYAAGQFTPVHNGKLDNSVPNESVLKAAQAVLDGENNVEGALYFHNPKISWNNFWAGLEEIVRIGNHRFAR